MAEKKRAKPTGVLKHGVGYDLVTVEERRYADPRLTDARLVLGIRCHTCQRTSYHPKDISERYCGHCKVFHEDQRVDQQA